LLVVSSKENAKFKKDGVIGISFQLALAKSQMAKSEKKSEELPMRIGIDAREIQGGISTGIGRALGVFLKYFNLLDDDNQIFLFSSKPVPVETGTRIANITRAEPHTFFWDQVTLDTLLQQYNIDIFYSPYYKLPLKTRCKSISTIYDLMYIFCSLYKADLSPLSLAYYKTLGKAMAHKADMIVTCSEYSKSEIIKFYNVPESQVKTIYLGLADFYKPQTDETIITGVKKKFNITKDYILYSGNFKPHKNVSSLIDSFAEIIKEGQDIQLVLAGVKSHHFDALRKKISDMNLDSEVIATGRVTEEEQVTLYSNARVFVMPSLYEGFGYPPLEAMACGAPVVSSDATSLKEVVGDAGLTFSNGNIKDMTALTLKVLNNSDLTKDLVEKGFEQVKKFNEQKYCEEFYKFLLGV